MIYEDERKSAADQMGFVMTLATSFMKSCGIRRIVRRDAFAAPGSVRYENGEKIATFMFRQRWMIIARPIAGICRTRICRTPGRGGRLCACGTTMIFLEGMAEPAGFWTSASGADQEGGGVPSVVRISARAGGESEPDVDRYEAPHVKMRRSRDSTKSGLGQEP